MSPSLTGRQEVQAVISLMSQFLTQACGWPPLLFLWSRAVVSNLLGTRDRFHGKQFFHRLGWEGVVWGWFKNIAFAVRFISIMMSLRRIMKYRSPWSTVRSSDRRKTHDRDPCTHRARWGSRSLENLRPRCSQRRQSSGDASAASGCKQMNLHRSLAAHRLPFSRAPDGPVSVRGLGAGGSWSKGQEHASL